MKTTVSNCLLHFMVWLPTPECAESWLSDRSTV